MLGRKKRLGDMLVDAGVITNEQLGEALKKQRELGIRLGQTLIELNFTNEGEIVEALHRQMGLPIAHIREAKLAPEVIGLLSEKIVRKHNVHIMPTQTSTSAGFPTRNITKVENVIKPT